MPKVCDDLEIGGFIFDGYLDHENEMEITAEAYAETVHCWVSKEKAQALIAHLTTVFGLEPPAA